MGFLEELSERVIRKSPEGVFKHNKLSLLNYVDSEVLEVSGKSNNLPGNIWMAS
jgi:hypothetical protein